MVVLMGMVAIHLQAHDIAVENAQGVTIYYNFTNEGNELGVTFHGDTWSQWDEYKYSGDVIIPESVVYNDKTYDVTRINTYAFKYCTELTSVTIGNKVTTIEDWAFAECTGLTSVTIPNSVTNIGIDPFQGCSAAGPIYNDNIFIRLQESYEGTYTIPDGIKTIADYAFFCCYYLSALTIPEGVTTIGKDAFAGCMSLWTLIIPDGVTTIGAEAFNGCEGLSSLTIPNSVTSIGGNQFTGCDNLSTPIYNATIFGYMPKSYSGAYTVPSGITTIIERAFEDCTRITSVTLPNSVTNIGDMAFRGCTGITEPVYNSTIFADMPNSYVGEYTIPSGITSIAGGAFEECTGLTSIVMPSSLTTIGWDAFRKCTALSSVTIPNGLKTISDFSFEECTALASITIPNSVTSIGEMAFIGCSRLESVIFDNCVPALLGNIFFECSPTDIYYPAYAYNYYTTNGQTKDRTLHPQIKIDREWTTYCATASFDVPEGIEAYVVKSYEDGVVTLKKVTTINEGEGLLLKPAEVGTFYDATVNGSPAAYDSNLLKGVTEATAITATDGKYTNFIFTNGSKGLGFYPTNSGTFPAYKAYLQIPTDSLSVSAREGISFVFENDGTAIKSVSTDYGQDNDIWYTLDGLRTTKPTQKGIYIHQGKKVNIK